MKNFLIIDDHKVVRVGVSLLLHEFYTPCNVVEAENAGEIEIRLVEHEYDLVILDINIPGVNTTELLKNMLQAKPQLKVLMFSMNEEQMYARHFLDIGAMGYLSKDTPVQEMKHAIDTVLADQPYYSEALIENTMHNRNTGTINVFDTLSPREGEILKMILSGKPLTEISKELSISVSTTGTHKAHIFKKLNVKNIVQLLELIKSKAA